MAEVRIPFSVTAELAPPFKLDETYATPNGVKSILLDKSKLQVVAKQETVEVPDVGPVLLCLFYVMGTVDYICNAFPIVQSDTQYDVQQQNALFTGQSGQTARDCVQTSTSDALGWVSASGKVHVNERVGGSCSMDCVPIIECVTVDDFAVAVNEVKDMVPTCPESAQPCGEEGNMVVKWRGCLVIITAEA